jgi:hypothetical protein
MKTRLATPIGKYLIVILKSGEKIIDEELDLNISDSEIKLKYDWEKLTNKYGELKAIGTDIKYDTPSGKLEPGCFFWNDYLPEKAYFDNQEGPMLMLVLPNGNHWNIDSRASNCGNIQDRQHRCWCRHGEVPNITVDKNGLTCNAGAGSIQSGNYHGFLKNGELTE